MTRPGSPQGDLLATTSATPANQSMTSSSTSPALAIMRPMWEPSATNESPERQPTTTNPSNKPGSPRRLAWLTYRILLFSGASLRFAYGDPRLLRTHIPGNPGDAFLVDAILQWGAKKFTNGYRGYWAGPFFAGNHNVMAYTETFLPVTPLFRLFSAAFGSATIAMNLVYLLAWVLTAEATYRLLHQVHDSTFPAFIGALAFTFSTIRLAQTGHFQLIFAFCIPTALLLVFKLRRRPSVLLSVQLGAVLAFQFLTSAYYGVILGAFVGTVGIISVIRPPQTSTTRESLRIWLPVGLTFVVLTAPVAVRYLIVQSTIPGRTEYPADYALRLGDLHTAAPLATYLNRFPYLRNNSTSRSSENFAYIGAFCLLYLPALALLLLLSQATRTHLRKVRFELITVSLLGLTAFMIAIGRGPVLGISTPFYDVARRVIPGVKSMLAIVRLSIFFQLGLTFLATAGMAPLLRRIRVPQLKAVLCLATLLVVLAEISTTIPLVRVPTTPEGSSYKVLRSLPEGVVVELPMPPRSSGVNYAFIEATRQLVGVEHNHKRLNGYSGYTPQNYDATVSSLNTFPSVDAYSTLKARDVRYIVLHTSPIDTGLNEVSKTANASGYAYISAEQAKAAISSISPGVIKQTITTSDGMVLVLT